jgi:hypothetical protein
VNISAYHGDNPAWRGLTRPNKRISACSSAGGWRGQPGCELRPSRSEPAAGPAGASGQRPSRGERPEAQPGKNRRRPSRGGRGAGGPAGAEACRPIRHGGRPGCSRPGPAGLEAAWPSWDEGSQAQPGEAHPSQPGRGCYAGLGLMFRSGSFMPAQVALFRPEQR